MTDDTWHPEGAGRAAGVVGVLKLTSARQRGALWWLAEGWLGGCVAYCEAHAHAQALLWPSPSSVGEHATSVCIHADLVIFVVSLCQSCWEYVAGDR